MNANINLLKESIILHMKEHLYTTTASYPLLMPAGKAITEELFLVSYLASCLVTDQKSF